MATIKEGIRRRLFRLGRFAAELIVSVLISVGARGAWAACLMAASTSDMLKTFLLLSGLFAGIDPVVRALGVTASYVVPIALAIFGIRKRRWAFVLGPLSSITVLLFLSTTGEQRYVRAIEALTPPTFTTPTQTHTVLALDFTSKGCNLNCTPSIRVELATSHYAVAIRRLVERQSGKWSDVWEVWRRAEGEACRLGANAKSALEFIRLGYIGFCAIETQEETLVDALLYREQIFNGFLYRDPSAYAGIFGAIDMRVPFAGLMIEVVERVDGHDHVLARHFAGRLHVSAWDVAMGYGLPIPPVANLDQRVGKGVWVTQDMFADAAHAVSDVELAARKRGFDAIEISRRLDAVEWYLDLPPGPYQAAVVDRAGEIWRELAVDDITSGLDVAAPRIERFLASHELQRTRVAVSLIPTMSDRFSAEQKTRMLSLLRALQAAPQLPGYDGEPERVLQAIDALSR